ncbi:MAG: hypothetical protein QF722_00020 [Candidatus Thalassarchaeaceae archaeon]|jgi:hypothetical protein|nr:hypothetical protein [Candidatus Thalassarchaeaceae archaeon]MDP6843920.1 hypothetical protein [Candidatus Thalassarchaeaceae archaeon]
MNRRLTALFLILMMLVPGCLESSEIEPTDVEDEIFETPLPTVIAVEQTDGCDNLNHLHCMLPFPSDGFLIEDNSTVTGLRVNYAENTLPVSGSLSNSGESVHIESLNLLDGMSPSTQIMTAFSTLPNLTGVADQYSIGLSMEAGHATTLLNLDTGEKVAHWVETDARADDDSATIVFIRTLRSLEPNTAYGIGISGLSVTPSVAFQAILDGQQTDAPDVESRQESMAALIQSLNESGHDIENLKDAWQFHTASLDSIVGPTLSMRADALGRLGNDGIGCTVETVDDDWMNDSDLDFRRIKGTYTVPQYLEWQNPPSKISTDANGTPQFVENAEIPFTLVIPQVLADKNESGPLVVFGHGFLGDGRSAVSSWAIGWMEEYEVAMVATDIHGWSGTDIDTVFMGLANPEYFEHQSDRLQQMLVNQMALARTFKGVCSDLAELHYNGTNLVDSSDVHYMGYSLGGIYGASITGFSPDIDRAALWVGGSGFSTFIERSTNYVTFSDGFILPQAYPQRNDRALLIAVCQQMWDASDAETWLRFAESGYGDEIQPFNILSTISVNDAQVPGLSSDRAARTAGIPMLNGSMMTPYGIDMVDGPINGSAIVYWDGGYDGMPDTNAAPPLGDAGLAHNEIAPIIQVNSMVKDFLLTGVINDTCGGSCTFDYDTEQTTWS